MIGKLKYKELHQKVYDKINKILDYLGMTEIQLIKNTRAKIQEIIRTFDSLPESKEKEKSLQHLTEARMWLGEDLRRIDNANPYPNSYDSTNNIIDAQAEELKNN